MDLSVTIPSQHNGQHLNVLRLLIVEQLPPPFITLTLGPQRLFEVAQYHTRPTESARDRPLLGTGRKLMRSILSHEPRGTSHKLHKIRHDRVTIR